MPTIRRDHKKEHDASYILIDYVSKWVEAIPTRTNDHKVVLIFLKEHIFSRF